MNSLQNEIKVEEVHGFSAVKEETERGNTSGESDSAAVKEEAAGEKEELDQVEEESAESEDWALRVKEEASSVEIGARAESPCEIEVRLEQGSESEESSERDTAHRSNVRARKRAHPLQLQQQQLQHREMEELSTLVDFLRERGMDEDLIKRMEVDKIDITVIPLMGDNELQQYIPHYGDRLAVTAFCLSNQPSQSSQLIEPPLARSFGPREEVSKKHIGNSYAKKKARRVELGWMNYNEKSCCFKQVRTANGGGTKHISINKQATMCDVQKMAERIFFPNGASRFFYLKDVECDIRDFSHRCLDENLTVGDLYDVYKVKILRLYLFTKRRNADNMQSSQDLSVEGASNYGQMANGDASFAMNSQTLENHFDRETENVPAMPRLKPDYDETIWEDQNRENHFMVNARWMAELNNQDSVYDVRTVPQTSEDSTSTGNGQYQCYRDDEDKRTGAQIVDYDSLDDTMPFDGNSKVVVEVRRGNCLSDMIGAFADPTIINKEVNIHMKLPNGGLEVGGGAGVFRDCLSEFWSEFYNRCTLGTDVKAPYLRHELQATEWQAIARVLLKGWVAEKYFPIHLPLPFLEEAIYGTVYSSVTEAFMLYVSKHDRVVLQHAMSDFQSVDQDSLLDVLDSYECHRMPTEENIAHLLSQLGHKALIQTPMFVIECWKPILKDLAKTVSPHRLVDIIKERVPSPQKVKTVLKFPEDMNAQQSTVARHLQRYIRELDDSILQRFLRFCTGADVVIGKHITVQFTEKKNFECRPQAHISGCLLLLPVKYQNYTDLRSSFNAVLNNAVWIMDII